MGNEFNDRSDLVRRLQKQLEPLQSVSQEFADLNRTTQTFAELIGTSQEVAGLIHTTQPFAELIRTSQELANLTRSSQRLAELTLASTSVVGQVISNFKTVTRMDDVFVPLKDMFRELKENTAFLNSLSIPHMPLYQDILESVDEEYISEIREDQSSDDIEEDLNQQEKVKIVNPSLFNIALTINVCQISTDDYIYNNPKVSEEEKTLWEKCIKPVLVLVVIPMFLTWAMGDTPVKDMQIVKQFGKVMKVIEHYQQPIETTDVEVKGEDI